jgi:hypothetical protein
MMGFLDTWQKPVLNASSRVTTGRAPAQTPNTDANAQTPNTDANIHLQFYLP